MSEPSTERRSPIWGRIGSDARRVAANFGWMLSGNYVSYGLSLATLAIIPRILGPVQYGVLGFAVATAGLLGALRLSGFDKLLIRDIASDPGSAGESYARVRVLKRYGSLAAVLGVLGIGAFTAGSVEEFVAVAILSGLNMTQAYASLDLAVLQGHERMRAVPIVSLVRQASYLALAVPLVVLVPNARRAIPVAAALLSSYVIGMILAGRFRRKLLPSYPHATLRSLKRPFVVSGLLFSSSAFFVYLYGRIDVLLIGVFLGPAQVGFYTLAISVLEKAQNPFMVLITAMFPTVVRRHRDGRVTLRDAWTLSGLFFVAATVVAALAWFVSPAVIGLVVGKAFLPAVTPLRILILSLPFQLMLYPFSQVLQAMRREDMPVKLAPIRAVLNVGFDLAVLSLGFGIAGVAWGTVATSLIFATIFVIVASRVIHRGGKEVSWENSKPKEEVLDESSLP